MAIEVQPAGSEFRRPGGRDGDWLGPPDPDDDDTVTSPFAFALLAGADAERALINLRQVYPATWPVLFGSVYDAGILFEHMEVMDETPGHWLAAARAFDLEGWFDGRVAEVKEWQAHAGQVLPPRGRWPVAPKRTSPRLQTAIQRDLDQPHETVLIGLVPTTDPADLGAFVHFGAWADCPEPPVHVVLARDWFARFGARPVAATYETLEFQVERPPTDREEAVRLALEHYHYCRETVPETLQAAAARLIGAPVWRFAWD
jgi:hypothetical protein